APLVRPLSFNVCPRPPGSRMNSPKCDVCAPNLRRPPLVSYRLPALSMSGGRWRPRMLRPLVVLMAVAMALVAVAVPAGGEEFYRGKTIRLIVPSDVGGGYDLYARTFATHLRRHVP